MFSFNFSRLISIAIMTPVFGKKSRERVETFFLPQYAMIQHSEYSLLFNKLNNRIGHANHIDSFG